MIHNTLHTNPRLKLAQAGQHRKNKQFAEAIRIYDSVFHESPASFTEWDAWSYIYSLQQAGHSSRSLEMAQYYYKKFPVSKPVKDIYARAIYLTQFIDQGDPDFSLLSKATLAILHLSTPGDPYSLAPRAVFKLTKALMAKPEPDWHLIEDWLLRLDPETLDRNSFKMELPGGKKVEFASPFEEWHAGLIRCKAGQGKHQALLDLLDKARELRIKWHYRNEIWFDRKAAFALHALGRTGEAVLKLKKIISVKPDWFLYADLADMTEDRGEKFTYYLQAVRKQGTPSHKINLYTSLAKYLESMHEHPEISSLLYELSALIRKQQSWRVPNDLISKVAPGFVESVSEKEIEGRLRQLQDWCDRLKPSQEKQVQKGTILYLHRNGQSGMLTSEDGRKMFFSLRNSGIPSDQFKEGTEVTYTIAQKENKHTGRLEDIATRLGIRKKK